MPRQGQRGVNPLREHGVCGVCPYPSLSLSRHLPLKGRIVGGDAYGPFGGWGELRVAYTKAGRSRPALFLWPETA